MTAAGSAGSIYGYDAMGRVTSQTSCLPSGCGNGAYNKPVAYGYNLAGMLTSEGENAVQKTREEIRGRVLDLVVKGKVLGSKTFPHLDQWKGQ